MAGLVWLDDKMWWEVSRDERYFCAELYHLIREDTARFTNYLNQAYGAQINGGDIWEVVYEACFYRDLWHARGRGESPLSPKRTFDLALFSNDEILLIEAKAQQSFDTTQLQSFAKDADEIRRLTGVQAVRLSALVSSRYVISQPVRAYFNGPILTWSALADLYDRNPKLLRADSLFEPAAAWTSQNNAGGYMTGVELVAAFERGDRFFVGRGGGLEGKALRGDVAAGGWRSQRYETNRDAKSPPNGNWFTLEAFVNAVGVRHG